MNGDLPVAVEDINEDDQEDYTEIKEEIANNSELIEDLNEEIPI